MMTITKNRLAGASFVPSPNQGGRILPELIILHDTAGPNAGSAINWFKNPKSKVSAHVVVDLDGSITQMVEFDRVAWHAGKSTYSGRSGCNGFSIGIEIVNPGILDKKGKAWFGSVYDNAVPCTTKEHGSGCWVRYTPAQIEAVTELCQALVQAYPTIKDISTHWYVSPGRKVDTNPLFPLDDVRKAAFDAAPKPGASESLIALGTSGRAVQVVQERLAELGYPVGSRKSNGSYDGIFGPQTRVAVLAFEAENGLTTDGALSIEERDILESAEAKPFPRGAREEATVADVPPTPQKSMWQQAQWWGRRVAVVATGVAADEVAGTGVVSTVEQSVGAAERVQSLFGRLNALLGGIVTPRLVLFGILIGIGLMLMRWGGKGLKQLVADYRAGKHLGA